MTPSDGTVARPDGALRARVKQAVMEAWPGLAEDAVTEVGFDAARLAELLENELGLEEDICTTDARNVMLSALVPTNSGNAGWVEVLDEDGVTPVARGQLYLHDTTPELSDGPPAGAIVHLRVIEEMQPLPAGQYSVRFEDSGEVRPVVALTDQSPMLPDMIAVIFMDDGQPVTVTELSAGG